MKPMFVNSRDLEPKASVAEKHDSTEYILELDRLKVATKLGAELVRSVSLKIRTGEIVGLVGESGAGKSITAMSIAGLLPEGIAVSQGSIQFKGREISHLTKKDRQQINGRDLGIIYQDAAQALNPLMRIGRQVGESLQIHTDMSKDEIKARVIGTLKAVQLPNPEALYQAYPHELSGGQRQRVLIAMAIINNPDLLIADEPTTALDVSVKNQILDLIRLIQQTKGNSVLYISHDLDTVSRICDRVYVLYDGRPIEEGKVEEVMARPKHPYTKLLLGSRPRLAKRGQKLFAGPSQEKPKSNQATLRLEAAEAPVLLDLQNVSASYQRKGHRDNLILENLNLTLKSGEWLGLVGESGSGKTTLARLITGFLPLSGGDLLYQEKSLKALKVRERVKLTSRGIQMIFQDPYSSFNPRQKLGRQLAEGLALKESGRLSRTDMEDRVLTAMGNLGLDPDYADRYPGQLSGGQVQRMAIAAALLLEPQLLLADEPLSALDLSVQAQILDLLLDLRQKFSFACLFISHDLSVVHHICDTIAVLKAGEIVEYGKVEEVFAKPKSAYTRQLIQDSDLR